MSSLATDPNAAEWHTGPARQFVITLTGHSEVEVSGGVHVAAGPGHINLIEDTTGKGHVTRNFGPDDRIALTSSLPSQRETTQQAGKDQSARREQVVSHHGPYLLLASSTHCLGIVQLRDVFHRRWRRCLGGRKVDATLSERRRGNAE